MAVNTKGGGPVLGLDIGSAFIKAVELKPGKGGLAITGVGVLPTPPGCIVNDEIVDPLTLAAAVKQLLQESGIKTKNVISSVAGQSAVVVRVIEVPKMTDKELAETMRWEIDRHIPFTPDEVVKDYAPITKPTDDPNAPNMSVLLAVAQNALIAGHMQTILSAGLTPVSIDVESLAGARALLDIDDGYTGHNVALVNLGASKTDVGIYEDGTLAFPRTIPVAGNAMTEAVARALDVDAAAAERLKKQYGSVPLDAATRFGSASQGPEETFSFGDDFGDSSDFGSTPEPASGFASTADGPVFGSPSLPGSEPTSGPFSSPAFAMPAFGSADGPVFDDPAPAVVPAPAFAQTADGPVFDVGDPEPVAPVIDAAPVGIQTPVPPTAAATTPVPPPVTAPEVLTEGEKHAREISDAFMPVLAEIVAEVKRSVEYYATRPNAAQVDRVVLFGGVASLSGLSAFVEHELGMPVQVARLNSAVSLGTNAVPAEYLSQVAALLPVAVGLAARDAIVTAPATMKKAA